MRKKLIALPLTLLALPQFAAAATLTDLVKKLSASLGKFVAVLAALALAVFLWGLVDMIRKSGSDTEIASGRKRMLWGIVGLTVVVSVWGIVSLLITLSGVSPTANCTRPIVKGDSVEEPPCD